MGLVRTLSQTALRASLETMGTGEAQSAKRRGADDVEGRSGEDWRGKTGTGRESVRGEAGFCDA